MVNRPLNNLFSPTFLVIHSTVAFGGGIILARPDFASSPPLLVTTFGLGLAGLLLALTNKRSHALGVLFFLLAGVCHGSQALAPPRTGHHIANLIPEQREVALIGVVDQAIEYGIEKTTLVMESQEIFIPSPTPTLLLPAEQISPPFQKATGRVKLSMRGRPAESFLPGDRLLIRAKISPPQGFNNPGGFNLSRFLASQDILISGWISSPQSLIRLELPPDHQRLLRHGAERQRARLINFMRLQLPEQQSALYRALITGDRAGLSPATVGLFRSLGIVHLLAISGLHMALLAGAIMALSFWLLQRSETILLHGSARKISACAAIIPLFLYCLIAGFQTPALRALIMTLIFFSALLSDRPWHGPTNVSLAALLILLISPLAITTVSFQLSFAAVTGIILILPLLRPFFTDPLHQNSKSKISRYLSGSIAVSLAASLATLPLLLYHFNRFALSSSLATLITEPFLCIWALGWGLPASLLSPFFPDLALFLFKTGGWGLDAALFLAEKMQSIAKSIWLPTPSLSQVIFFYICLFLFIKTEKIWLRVTSALCSLLLFLPYSAVPSTDQATILDVGQGNCVLIETSNGKVLIIDAGGPSSPTFDIGRQVIAPVLWSKGIKSIDLLVLSHPDEDHYSGAAFLLDHFPTKTLWIPTRNSQDYGWQKTLAIAEKRHTFTHIPEAGEFLPLGSGREISSLADLHLSRQTQKNNQGLVLKFTAAGHSLLMPGDIETEAERELIHSHLDLTSTMIIAPHHGSASSSSRDFLTQVAPQTVIFSASRYKKPHFPSPAVEQRYHSLGIFSLSTAESGAITVLFDKEGLKTATWQ